MNAQSTSKTPTPLILVIGVVIGLLLAGAVVLVKSALDRKEASPTTETRGIVLSIDKPVDGAVVSDANLTIEGTSGKDAVVAVTGGADDPIVETSSGKFSTTISLTEGENELGIYAFDPTSGESAQTTLSVLYLQEAISSGNVLVAASSTESAEKTKERIEKLREQLATKSSDLKKAASNPSSHIFGTLSAISKSSFTVETRQGGLTTVFTDDLTKFYSIGEKSKSVITLADLKVGDKVSVVGLGKDNIVGTAKSVVKINKPITKRSAVAGKVKSIDGTSLTLTHIIHTDRTFTVNVASETMIKIKGKETATLADIKVGDFIVAAGSVDEKGILTAKRVFVIGVKPKEATKSATPSSTQ